MLETAPITTAGTYSLIVSGSGGTTGGYTLQAILNAVFKQATDTNNSIALGLRPERVRSSSLGTTPSADRAGVLGTIDSAGDPDYLQVLAQRRPVHDAGRAGTERKRRPGLLRRIGQSPRAARARPASISRSTWVEVSAAPRAS